MAFRARSHQSVGAGGLLCRYCRAHISCRHSRGNTLFRPDRAHCANRCRRTVARTRSEICSASCADVSSCLDRWCTGRCPDRDSSSRNSENHRFAPGNCCRCTRTRLRRANVRCCRGGSPSGPRRVGCGSGSLDFCCGLDKDPTPHSGSDLGGCIVGKGCCSCGAAGFLCVAARGARGFLCHGEECTVADALAAQPRLQAYAEPLARCAWARMVRRSPRTLYALECGFHRCGSRLHCRGCSAGHRPYAMTRCSQFAERAIAPEGQVPA